jgi:hypothetical protein
MARWTWAAASRQGTSHAKAGTRRQDAITCTSVTDGSRLIAVLCDGAGSASMGGEGAALAARVVGVRARTHLERCAGGPDDETVQAWIGDVRDAIGHAAEKRQLRPRDFATTLICVLSDGNETIVIHIGDGCVVAKNAADQDWHAVTWPAHGEYASTTYFITDEPEPNISIRRYSNSISALVAFTDGMERLALNFAAETPHAPFLDGIVGPVLASSRVGRDEKLSSQLAGFLDSQAVTDRTDDDKTLLVAAFR